MSDSILFWNDVALEANRVSHTNMRGEQTGPPLSARALAIVHLAMHDAYFAIDTSAGFATYLPTAPTVPPVPVLPPVPPGSTARAAVAGAAHAALSALFPSQRDYFDTKLGQAGNVLDPGHAFGVAVANAIIQDRATDPGVSDAGYTPHPGRHHHRADPDNPAQGYHAPYFGQRSKAFAVTTRYTLDAPPSDAVPATKAEYEAALRQVRGRGIAPELMGTLPSGMAGRTIDQTVVGLYWGYDGAVGLGTPPRLYNQIIRRLAMDRSPGSATTPNPAPNTEAQNARLFALVNVAMADAGILSWDDKYRHDFWRPVVGIREHDGSMGPGATTATDNLSNDTDTGWLPFGAPSTNSQNPQFANQTAPAYPCNHSMSGRKKNFTPPFPAYPSGHATFGAAAFHIARRFYNVPNGNRANDTLFAGLDFVSEELNGVNQDNNGTIRPRHVRHFPGGLWQMILENGRSRVFLGVHWVFDAFAVGTGNTPDLSRNIGGVRLGVDIAEDIFTAGMLRSAAAGPRVPTVP